MIEMSDFLVHSATVTFEVKKEFEYKWLVITYPDAIYIIKRTMRECRDLELMLLWIWKRFRRSVANVESCSEYLGMQCAFLLCQSSLLAHCCKPVLFCAIMGLWVDTTVAAWICCSAHHERTEDDWELPERLTTHFVLR